VRGPLSDFAKHSRGLSCSVGQGFPILLSRCTLSGAGTSACIAHELVRSPDILVMDGADQHLELEGGGIVWLEDPAGLRSAAYLVVSTTAIS